MYMYLLEMKIGSLMRVCYSTMVATNFSRNFSNTRKNFPRIFFFFSPVRISICTTIFDFSFHFFSSYFATIFRAYRKSIFAIWSKKKILSEKKKKRKNVFSFASTWRMSESFKKIQIFFCQNPSFPSFSFSIPEIKRRSDNPSSEPRTETYGKIKGIESNLPI